MSANFIVEDGTVVANANSFASVAYADQYFLDRGITTWTGSTSVRQTALVRATDYINTRFRFKGYRYGDTIDPVIVQALEFPRDALGALPDKLLRATCEYAIRALSATLAPDLTVDDTGRAITSKTEKVGPLEETTAYQPGGTVYVFRPYPSADILLRDLVVSRNQVIRG